MKSLNQPLTPKAAAFSTGILTAALLLGWGGWRLYCKLTARPPSTSDVRRQIWSYLEKQVPGGDFSTEFATGPISNSFEAVTFTNKNGKVKNVQRGKRSELGLPETSLSVYFRTNQAEAASYDAMYRLIGQQLKITEHLLESDILAQKHSGLVMASEASNYARNSAQNLWLAARICEGYLWPNLSLVEGTNQAGFTTDALLNICDMAFKEAEETDNIVRNYEYLIARTTRPQQADTARFRLARIYQDMGQEEKAVATLKQIKNFKNGKVEQLIAALEQRIAKKKQR